MWTASRTVHEASGRSKRFRAAATYWTWTIGSLCAKPIGDSMILLLDLCVPGVDFTTRISTTVIRIELISTSSDEDL